MTSFVNEHVFNRIMATNSDRDISNVARFIYEVYIFKDLFKQKMNLTKQIKIDV